jgi:dolichol kinase
VSLKSEIKRKAFHHLSLLYLGLYWILPRSIAMVILGVVLLAIAVTEFIRLRRPEVNAWFLKKFGGIHRESEVLSPSGIFWTLFGTWLTIVVFTNKKIVLAALGFLVFGDTAAALVGKKWGKRPWAHNPERTKEGSLGFVLASCLWAVFFVRAHVAIAGALVTAWIESKRLPFNDNFWIPLAGGAALSVLNLVIGR